MNKLSTEKMWTDKGEAELVKVIGDYKTSFGK